ncbi:hypothetical protein C5167_032717 [Papaver somniferum]|uniref:Uncharacterized protein n=1 Tax=Papaver somniferum TaxID=3469 RepID=A0A4Y7K7F7_PAPSO|nr:uncharacterized protein LOC113292987 [Papaver somniferum]RZC68746.1 hypothetical protein C5167_032717 [Papaver somniferum]
MDSVESMFSQLKLHAESACTIVVAYLGRIGVALATDGRTAGDGVFPIAAGITKLADPCPLPSASKMKGLSENAGYTQVELARTQQTYRQRRAMVFPKGRPRTIRQLHKVCKHDPCPEIVKYGTTIFTINCGIEGGIYVVVDGLGHTPRRHDGEEELEVHVEEAHEMDGDDSEDGDDTDDICGWKEQKAYYLGNNYMVAAVAGSNTWFKPIIQNRTRRMRGNKKLNPEQCAKFTDNYLNNKKNKPNLHKYSMTLEELREANQMKCEIIYGAFIHHKGDLVPSVFVGNETEVLEVVHHQRTGRTRWKPSFFAGGSGAKFADQVLRYYADQIASDSLTSEEIRMICFEAMEQAYLQDPGTGGMFTVYHIQYDTISEYCVDCTRVRAVIENFNKKKHQQKRRKVKQVEKRQAWQQARARRFRKKRKN